jgi:predicted ATP-grasp superfamily ATP-dependent carboligase
VRVLVTNAEERSVIATCRCLHDAGYEVTAVSASRRAPGHWSHACSHRLVLPDPREDAEAFVRGLEAELGAREHAALLAATDPALVAVAHARERLEGLTRLGLPEPAAVRRGLDRLALPDAARAAGLDTPATRACEGLDEARECAEALGWPVLLKARHPAVHSGGRVLQAPPARPAADADALAEMLPRYGTPCLVQRSGDGPVNSFGGVMAGGRLLGFVASRYVRTWPPAAGSVAFSETFDAGEATREAVTALLAAVGWEGIFELEAIGSPQDGLSAIDLNPRPYGSMALAAASGAPLASTWVSWLVGRDPSPVVGRPGVRYRWEDADLRNALWRVRRGRLGEAARILIPHRHVTHPYFRLTDPAPLAARLLDVAGSRLRRRAEKPSAGP